MALITIKGVTRVVSIDWLWIPAGAFSVYISIASAGIV